MDDALSWAGDDEHPQRSSRDLEPRAARESAASSSNEEGGDNPRSALVLVLSGIIAGVYLLYTVGWLLSALRFDPPFSDLLQGAMYQLGEALAVAAPLLWALSVLALTRRRSVGPTLLWLLLGAVVLLPWPFVMGVR